MAGVTAESKDSKTHELWWTHCIDHTVPLDDFLKWVGPSDAMSRKKARNYVMSKKFHSILDVPAGMGQEFWGWKNELPESTYNIDYTAVDITPLFVDKLQKHGIKTLCASIEKLPFQDHSFDIVYCRHILEHLDNFEKAITEVYRVCKYEVLIVFFVKPNETMENLIKLDPACNGHPLYTNSYSRPLIDDFLFNTLHVTKREWKDVNAQECFLHLIKNNK